MTERDPLGDTERTLRGMKPELPYPTETELEQLYDNFVASGEPMTVSREEFISNVFRKRLDKLDLRTKQ